MLRTAFCICLGLTACCAALGEIEKTAVLTDHGMKFLWWPKLKTPTGWVRDEDTSRESESNILIPKGATFANAPAVIYARAFYQPDKKKKGTLRAFIDDDLAGMREHYDNLTLKEVQGTKIKAGVLRTYAASSPGKVFERICYGAEGDFWIMFIVSAKTHADLDKALPTFQQILSAYH